MAHSPDRAQPVVTDDPDLAARQRAEGSDVVLVEPAGAGVGPAEVDAAGPPAPGLGRLARFVADDAERAEADAAAMATDLFG